MDRAHAAIVQTDEIVVHVVGKLTESAFAFVGSASQALGDNGIPQTVILANDAPHPALLAKFHPSVRLELAPPSAGPMKQFRHAVKLLCHEANTIRGGHPPAWPAGVADRHLRRLVLRSFASAVPVAARVTLAVAGTRREFAAHAPAPPFPTRRQR
jgi:hypothetical protein